VREFDLDLNVKLKLKEDVGQNVEDGLKEVIDIAVAVAVAVAVAIAIAIGVECRAVRRPAG